MDANGEFDVNSLSQRDKQELQQFIQNETQKSKLQQCMSSPVPPLPFPTSHLLPPFPHHPKTTSLETGNGQ